MPEAAAALPDDVLFFHVDLGHMDVLLAASDFYAAAAKSDFVLEEGPGRPSPRLEAKGRSHDCVFLEPFFEKLFSPTLAAEGSESVAFLMNGGGGRGERAFVIDRSFEMRTLPLREFRLLPRGIRVREATLGLAALRFEGGTRLQILMNAGALESTPSDGGARSRSS